MISVIVPVYNVEKYLSKCLQSLLEQEFEDLEIILIDDGSTDDCPRICDSFAMNDSRVIVIHKENGGLSDARNVGIDIAHGEWTCFIDSDDWFEKGAIKKLYEYAVNNECDIVQGNFYYAFNDHLLYRCENRKERSMHILDRFAAMRELIINDRIKNFAWGKIYKTSIVKRIKFPKGKFYEDSYWQHLAVDQISKYGIIDIPIYYYRQREDSISGQESSRYNDLIGGYKCRLDFVEKKYPQYTVLMRKMYTKIYDNKYPRHNLFAELIRIFRRIKNRLFPSTHFKSIKL